ncbi:MAG: hypothetical protein ACRDHZ_02395 [Ktedonobacteraceae bacterium]
MAEEHTSPANPTSETPNGTALTSETLATQANGETPGTATEQSPAEIRKENERLAAALKRANAEAKQHRETATELQKFKEQIEQQNLSAQQKLEQQLAKAQKEHADFILQTRDRLVASELRAHAARLGFADPADAVAMIKQSELEFDDDGVPSNAAVLLEKLLKAKPYLAGKALQATPTAGGATSPARSQTSDQQINQEYINRLTPQEYNALSPEKRREITQWQADHPYRFGQRH